MRLSEEYSILVTLIGTEEMMEPPLAVSVDSSRKSAPGRSDTENSIVLPTLPEASKEIWFAMIFCSCASISKATSSSLTALWPEPDKRLTAPSRLSPPPATMATSPPMVDPPAADIDTEPPCPEPDAPDSSEIEPPTPP
mmetsp:Transcript_3071/g.9659  ORF Transcript_3071/g.9659 Transcript_3071/m.9659 type:complete len:139 (-) Transcript_3071:36-452(-)